MSTPGFRALAVMLGLLLSACGQEAPKPQRPPPAVSVLTVTPRTIPADFNFVAQTESSRQVDIMARVSGFLDKIAYREGELVKEGQILFQLDPKPFEAQLDAARGELKMQQARLETAEATYGRVKPLADQEAVSKSDLDRATGDRDAARAAVFAAQAKIREAELNLGYTTIRSPVAGVAGASQQRQGAYINSLAADAKLTYVAALDPMWVNFSVSQNQVAKSRELVAQGRLTRPEKNSYAVAITLSDGKLYAYQGTIDFSDPSFSQDTGAFLVRAVIPNPKHELRPGMFVTATVKGATRPDAIVVPQLAVQQGEKGHFAFVIGKEGLAEVRPVVVGDYDGEQNIVIQQGLHGGDRVVVEGVQKVVPGKPVHIVEPGTPPGAQPKPAAKP